MFSQKYNKKKLSQFATLIHLKSLLQTQRFQVHKKSRSDMKGMIHLIDNNEPVTSEHKLLLIV